jgi:hypothetical protein
VFQAHVLQATWANFASYAAGEVRDQVRIEVGLGRIGVLVCVFASRPKRLPAAK